MNLLTNLIARKKQMSNIKIKDLSTFEKLAEKQAEDVCGGMGIENVIVDNPDANEGPSRPQHNGALINWVSNKPPENITL